MLCSKISVYEKTKHLAANTSTIGDWKIIKIQEARLAGQENPYDLNELMIQQALLGAPVGNITKLVGFQTIDDIDLDDVKTTQINYFGIRCSNA